MKKIQLALAISMILAAQSVWAASTADIINIQQAKGTANFDNIQATATGGTQTINIYQASSGAGSTDMGSATSLIATAPTPPNANDSNQVSLLVNGTTGSSTVKIGQGYYNNSGTWTASQTGGTTNNVVYGTVTNGSANISQNSDGNTVKFNLGAGGSGLVTVNQGFAGTNGGGGSGLTADITQTGTGSVTVNQGNASGSLATSGTTTVNNAGAGTISVTQGNGTATSNGVVLVKTSAVGTGSLTITQTGAGAVNVVNSGNAVALNGTAIIQNTTGTINLTQIDGTVGIYNNGPGTLNVANGGATNAVYVNTNGTSGDTSGVTL
ncbi:MAG: hypothetical protein D0530_00160, partial [Methylococcales bacterium]